MKLSLTVVLYLITVNVSECEPDFLDSTSEMSGNALETIDRRTDEDSIEVRMPGVRPTQNDDYICTAKRIDFLGTQYVHKFEADSNADRAHHMLLYACDSVSGSLTNKGSWKCGHHDTGCQNKKTIYAWAKNAPPTILPTDVGFRLGPESNNNYLVLQIHYARGMPEGTKDTSGFKLYISKEQPKFLAGLMFMSAGNFRIPPNTAKTHGDMNCVLRSPNPIYPFACRVHTHKLGVVVSAYVLPDGSRDYKVLAKGNPQWPQAFYALKENLTINPKDLVAGRCTYNSTNFNHTTRIGMTANDEMCNIYIMFYTASKNSKDLYLSCNNKQVRKLPQILPADSDVPLPRNKSLEEHAMGHGQLPEHKDLDILTQNVESEITKTNSSSTLVESIEVNDLGKRKEGTKLTSGSIYDVKKSWPDPSVKLGQASGVAFDTHGNVVVFHRGNRTWNSKTFDNQNRYLHQKFGPISINTVFVIHPTSGKILHEWGENRFYMPHDITVAPNGDTFLTDVALHQVFRFAPGTSSPSLTLGEAFMPGSDETHFCQPAAVAVMTSGDFFVADGYCNSRIIKYDSEGKILLSWGQSSNKKDFRNKSPPPYAFAIPHALALAEDRDMIFVADRENGRIQCFSASEGKFHYAIESPDFGGKLFSVAYSPVEGGTLFAVNGRGSRPNPRKVQGFVIPLSSRNISSVFSPNGQGFGKPHDVAVSKDGSQIYVVEISVPYKVWKFERNLTKSLRRTKNRNHDVGVGIVEARMSGKQVLVPKGDRHGQSQAAQPKLPNEADWNKFDGSSEIDDDASNSSEIDDDSHNLSEINDDASSSSEIDDDSPNSSEIGDDASNSSEMAVDDSNSSEIDNKAPSSAEISDDPSNASEMDTDDSNQAEMGDDHSNSSEMGDDHSNSNSSEMEDEDSKTAELGSEVGHDASIVSEAAEDASNSLVIITLLFITSVVLIFAIVLVFRLRSSYLISYKLWFEKLKMDESENRDTEVEYAVSGYRKPWTD